MAVNSSTTPPGPDAHPEPAAPPVDPASAEALDRATAELSQLTDRAPSPELIPAVMNTVWAELRPGRQIPFPGSNNTLFITETAAGNALVAEIDGLAGVIVRRCSVDYLAEQATEPGVGSDAGDGSIQLTLTVALAYGAGSHSLLEHVRSVLQLSARELLGRPVSQVDIDVVDVYPATGQRP